MSAIREGGLKIGDAAEACRKYLGTKVSVSYGDRIIVRFDQEEYANAIVQTYQELFGTLPHVRRFPGAWNAHTSAEPQRDVHRSQAQPIHDNDPIARRKRQVVIGMLLWHSRSVRADIAGYVNYLATRIHAWTARDDVFLQQLIGFLRFSAAKALVWDLPSDDALEINALFDANLQVPRSHCSYDVCIGSKSNQCLALVDWGNKKATLTCTASAASELCAAYYCASNVTGLCSFLHDCIETSDFDII